MHLTINGKKQEVRSSGALEELLRELDITSPHFAVAINHQVIPRSQHPSTKVKEGDHIEIVHAVGGGL